MSFNLGLNKTRSLLLRQNLYSKIVKKKNQTKEMSMWSPNRYDLDDKTKVGKFMKRYKVKTNATAALKVALHFLQLRYFVLGGTVVTLYNVKKEYEKTREDFFGRIEKFTNVLPSTENLTKLSGSIYDSARKVSGGIGASLCHVTCTSMSIHYYTSCNNGWTYSYTGISNRVTNAAKTSWYFINRSTPPSGSTSEEQKDEVMNIRDKYEKKMAELREKIYELEKQKRDIKNIRVKEKKEQKSLVEMYSEVLDELSGYGDEMNGYDHLPRVVVVGDQSAGKTSVLEMLAQARIFPRGAGEMMTRAPVKVTLSEGPYHIAQIQGSSREFDLQKEADLADLRKIIEIRMKKSVRRGHTVSKEVISMTVKGPGLNRMVLIDLPGIISTQTVDMAADTREAIKDMSKQFMDNPNAIILCIQDGSVDAERSNVTDLVAQSDPTGKRTIFVLTKVDLAEQNMSNPKRIKKILSGELFPMKALGYFAVITGNGNREDSIENIKKYEDEYFKSSKLLRQGIVKTQQVSTSNLSKAVAECFWKMVKESVEQQADVFRAKKFNLETEWKNSFPRKQQLDREQLFYRAREEILDQSVCVSLVPATVWEEMLTRDLWRMTIKHVFDNIYLPAAASSSIGVFNTIVDIRLKEWAEDSLLQNSINCGCNILKSKFKEEILKDKLSSNHDDLFDELKKVALEEALRRHSWDSRARESLMVLQQNALQDKSLKEKAEWDDAVTFLETSIKDNLKVIEDTLHSLVGPSSTERWIYWKHLNDAQKRRRVVKDELDKMLNSDKRRHMPELSFDDLIAVKNNVQVKGVEVSHEFIRETWIPIYKKFFLSKSLENAQYCRKDFYLFFHEETRNQSNCHDVLLFWRIRKMIRSSANALRQQITNVEAQRLHKLIKKVLDEIGTDKTLKKQLLTGRRVVLAEELHRVRQIHEKLEDFITVLKSEK